MTHLFCLSDAAWLSIEMHLAASPAKLIRPTGHLERDVSAAYGPPTTIYNRFTYGSNWAFGNACSRAWQPRSLLQGKFILRVLR